jgi:hypothetical protein
MFRKTSRMPRHVQKDKQSAKTCTKGRQGVKTYSEKPDSVPRYIYIERQTGPKTYSEI